MFGGLSQRNRDVRTNQFSMVPRQDVPRATFRTEHAHKTTFDAARLVPFFVDEVLPGDVHQGKVTIFARTSTPLFPIMDDLHLDTHFFFVPYRLVWDNWVKMMGERRNPSDSIDYVVPHILVDGASIGATSIYDYFGIPVGQFSTDKQINALPFRAYNLIYNEWFRDQNLNNELPTSETSDGPDNQSDYSLRFRNKAHDYFTSALPWPTKNGVIPSIPLQGQAPIFGIALNGSVSANAGNPAGTYEEFNGLAPSTWAGHLQADGNNFQIATDGSGLSRSPRMFADLTQATGVALNAMRLAVATQQLLEKDARGGTRYTELLRNHFGVDPEDYRLQRPEYIGGGRSRIQTQAIPQTSEGTEGAPLGLLGASAIATGEHRFSYAAKEHGVMIGLVSVRGTLTYQQGVHRMFTRRTRYDFYWPTFANLGEQIVRNDEIFARGDGFGDDGVFGYQERWAEYRHRPSRISGLFRSTAPGNIDEWHLAEQFGSMPGLNASFIADPTGGTLSRALAAGSLANAQQMILDALFEIRSTRPLPMFSVPGLARF